MTALGDSIVLPDATLARVTIFPLKGTSVRTIDVGRASAAGFFGVDPIVYGRAALILLGGNNAERGSDLALFARAQPFVTLPVCLPSGLHHPVATW